LAMLDKRICIVDVAGPVRRPPALVLAERD